MGLLVFLGQLLSFGTLMVFLCEWINRHAIFMDGHFIANLVGDLRFGLPGSQSAQEGTLFLFNGALSDYVCFFPPLF